MNQSLHSMTQKRFAMRPPLLTLTFDIVPASTKLGLNVYKCSLNSRLCEWSQGDLEYPTCELETIKLSQRLFFSANPFLSNRVCSYVYIHFRSHIRLLMITIQNSRADQLWWPTASSFTTAGPTASSTGLT